jgi:ZIP family zinc transporter
MESTPTPPTNAQPGWAAGLGAHARAHVPTTVGLAVAGLALSGMLLASVSRLASGQGNQALALAFMAGMACFAANALGALPALLLRSIPKRVEHVLLGFAAGMMLAASFFSLLMPALEVASELTGQRAAALLVVVAGLALGTLLMLGLHAFTPHEHEGSGACGPGNARVGRVWLFAFAIALHNLPEGMAVGVAFAEADFSVGLPVAGAIALQDMPEGLVVALAMRAAGFNPLRAVMVSVATGALEPVGALLGVALSSGFAIAYPIGLALAAGAMLFVVSHEVIPETHGEGHETPATIGLMAGFALMMVLDTMFA